MAEILTGETVYCPACPPFWIGKKNKRRGDLPLQLLERNYSGTGVDIAFCPNCNKKFAVHYQVAKVEPIDF
jgi:hypothetical protein